MSRLTTEALDTQVDLIRFYETGHGQSYTAGILDLMVGDVNSNAQPAHESRSRGAFLPEVLNIAETYAITDEIAEVVDIAKELIPNFELHLEDLPAPHGYLHFASTRTMLDSKGKTLAVKSLMWISMRMIDARDGMQAWCPLSKNSPLEPHALMLVAFTDARDERDHMHPEHLLDLEKYGHDHPVMRAPYWGLMCGIWVVGQPVDFENNDASVIPMLMTFFRFIQEPWVDVRMMAPSERQVRKRVIRARVTPEVRVVCLRELAHHRTAATGESTIEYSHRWIVRPHWRQQWYPSQQRHAPRWIPAHIKGPEDRPLLVKDRVFHVSR